MENWWEAAPVVTNDKEGGDANWWDAAPVVQERADTSAMGRIGKAFDLGEAAAVTGGMEMVRDTDAALTTSAFGRGVDAAGDFVDKNILSNADGTPNMLGRLANRMRSSEAERDGVPRQMVGGPDITPEQRREAILNKDLGAAYDGARGVLAQLAAEGFSPKSYDEVNGFGSAAQFIAENLAASAPQMGASVAAGALGPALNVILLGAEVNDELKARTDLTLDQRVAVATGAGTFMAALEQFGLAKMLGPLTPGKVAVDALDGKLVDVLTKNGVPPVLSRTIETAIVEGTTESLQEATVMGVTALSGGEYTAEEVADRLAQSFTAGAGVGGAVGGVTNTIAGVRDRDASDTGVSTGETSPDQTAALAGAPTATTPQEAPAQAVPDEVSAALDAARGVLSAQQVTPEVTAEAETEEEAKQRPADERKTPAPAPAPVVTPEQRRQQNLQLLAEQRAAADMPAQGQPPAEAVAQEETIAPEPEAEPTAESEGDTLPTVPEAPETLEAQATALTDPKNARKAMWIPNETIAAGGVVTPQGNGIRSIVLDGGVLFWSETKTGKIGPSGIKQLYRNGNLGEFLGLGPITKAQAAQSAAAGSPPAAITERAPDGTELKAAAGTLETAPTQLAAFEAEKAPDSTVQIEAPQNVIAERIKARSRAKAPANPVRQVELTPELRAQYEQAAAPAPAAPEATPAPAAARAKDVSRTRSEVEELPDGRRVIRVAPTAEEQRLITERADAAAAARGVSADVRAENTDQSARVERANKGEFASVEEEIAARRGMSENKNAGREKAAVENAVKTKKLFDDMAPKQPEDVRGIRDAAKVYQRLENTLKEAKKRGISVINRVLPSHTNAQVWLASVRTMARKLQRLDGTPSEETRVAIMGDLASFLSNEFLLVDTGDSTGLREDRAEAGTMASAGGKAGAGSDITDAAADDTAMTGEETLIAEEEATQDEMESVPDEATEQEDDEPDVPEIPDVPAPVTPEVTAVEDDGTPAVRGFQERTAPVETKKKRILKPGRAVSPAEANRIKGKILTAAKRLMKGRRLFGTANVPAPDLIEKFTLNELADMVSDQDFQQALVDKARILAPKEARLQKLLANQLFKAINDVVGNVNVYVVSDQFMDMIDPDAQGAYFNDGDYILIRERATRDRNSLTHIVLHEGAHAAFEAAIEANPQLKWQLRFLMRKAKANAKAMGYPESAYGFTDIHEFLSEAWSNPQFQELLANTPLTSEDAKALGIKGTMVGQIRSVMSWLKFSISRFLGAQKAFAQAGFPVDTKSAMDGVLDIAGRLLEVSPQARANAASPAGRRASIAMDPSPDSLEGKLRSRGLTPAQATAVADLIMSDFDGKVTDADLDAIAEKVTLAVTGQTPSAGGNTGSPKIDQATRRADDPKGKDATGWRAFLLKLRTLDDIVRTYGDRFMDAKGNAMLDYLNGVFSYEPVRREVEDRHNMDFAEFEDFRNANPEEAKKLSDLITELAPFDVNLGPNADNKHLDGNAKANLQAKARLPELQAQYDALSPEAKALLEKMSKNYRESHNRGVRGVVRNALALLDNPLPAAEVDRLTTAAVEGKLTDADKALIDNDTVFQTLANAKELRLRKGLYFPSVRFGDYVVTTETAIDDPGITEVTLKTKGKKFLTGKAPTVPVTSEVTGGTVRFTVDPDVRGARTALDRTVSEWVSKHELPLASYRIKYKDRTTGELVTKSNQRSDRDYDYVIEVNFQNKGVHFFETEAEAKTFSQDAQQDVINGVLTEASVVMARHNTQDLGTVIKGSVAEALMRSFDARNTDDDGTATRRAQAQALLQEIIAQQLPGNRYEKRLLKRKNVKGYSEEVGRAAAHYGRQAGNYIAAVETAPARHDAFDRILEIERERGAKDGVISQVVNELRAREQEVGQNHHTSQLADNLVMINGWDKLASAANWMINGTQVITNSLSILGGRHGNGATVAALTAAYDKIGTGGTLLRGARNMGKAVTQVGKTELDTEDLIANIRQKLGPKYADLMDALVDTGDVAADVGIESATLLSGGAGKFTKGIAKVDRIVRQMPNTVEAINRTVTAVAAYDLGRKDGMSHEEAIAHAQDVTRQTQGRYDLANSPVWMQRAGILRFALVFKKYAQLQYQLLGDILRRAFTGATPKEKAIAAKQFGNLMTINLAIGGMLGLPGIELAKLAALGGMAFGGDEWEEWQEKWRAAVRSVAGEDLEQVINKGALSKALDVDLQSRMGWQDLVTGFAPKALDAEGFTSFIGTTILGAPGGMAIDLLRAREAWQDGEVLKALGFMIPVKQVVDAAKTARGVSEGEMTTGDAVRQAVGFRSLRQAEIGDQLGAEIRDSKDRQSDRKRLETAWMNADTAAEVARATAAIRRYNDALPDGQRRISIDALRRYKAQDRARFN